MTNDNNNLSLLDEFKSLIEEVTKEIVDHALMNDLNAMRQELNLQLESIKHNAESMLQQIQNSDQILEKGKTQMTVSMQTTLSNLSEFTDSQKEHLSQGFNDVVDQLNTFKDKIENLYEEGHSKVENALHQEFVRGQASLKEEFESTQNTLSEMMRQSTELIEDKEHHLRDQLNQFYTEARQAYEAVLNETNNSIQSIFETYKSSIEEQLSNFDQNRQNEYDSYLDQLNKLFEGYQEKLSDMIHKTDQQMNEELSNLRTYLSNGEKLISSNQKKIVEIQRSIEEKLNASLVSIVEESEANKKHIENGLTSMDTLVEKVNKELFRLTELNNTINIKMDHNIQKMKALEKNNKRILLMTGIFGGVITIGVIVNIILSFGG